MQKLDKETLERMVIVKRTELHESWIKYLNLEIERLKKREQMVTKMCLYVFIIQMCTLLVVWLWLKG